MRSPIIRGISTIAPDDYGYDNVVRAIQEGEEAVIRLKALECSA